MCGDIMDIKKTNLDLEKGFIYFDSDIIKELEDNVLNFIKSETYLESEDFVKKVMLRREIKTNNSIEGIIDDLSFINQVIENRNTHQDNKRIINLYKGYQYILRNKDINKNTLKELYAILSDGLLTEEDLNGMGDYYRSEPVYIYKTSRYDEVPYMGVSHNKLDYYMDKFFSYVNTNDDSISKFIKSQIMHFYFVYIHPYFDVNGRCSRTVSMWYILNNQEYPFIIFNRAISFERREYIENIIKSREGDITPFLKYMLVNVKREFEKEYIINNIVVNSSYKLSKEEFETLCYLLSLKGEMTIKDLATIYNFHNPHKSLKLIIEEKLKSLIDKNIIILGRETNTFIYKGIRNRILEFNLNYLDIDTSKLDLLDTKRIIKK